MDEFALSVAVYFNDLMLSLKAYSLVVPAKASSGYFLILGVVILLLTVSGALIDSHRRTDEDSE